MKKNLLIYITVIVVATFFSACDSTKTEEENDLIADIIEKMDDLSFEDSKKVFLEGADYFSMISNFWENDDKPEDIAEDKEGSSKEKYTLPELYNFNDFKKETSITQSLSYPSSSLTIKGLKEDNSSFIRYNLKTIYYKDGSTENVDKSVSSDCSLSNMKPIDSIRLTINYKYTTRLKELVLSKKEKEVSYKGGKIAVSKIDKNFIQYVMDDTVSSRFVGSQIETRAGNILDYNSSVSGGLSPENQSKYFKKLNKGLGEIAERIKADKYKNKEELVEDIVKFASKMPSRENDKYYRAEYYKGNVDKLILYFSDEKDKDSYTLTIPVASNIGDYNIVEKNGLFGIVDSDGETVVDIKLKNLDAINSYYYSSIDYYNSKLFHLNTETRQLETITRFKPENVSRLTHDLAVLSYRHKYGVLGKYGELIIPAVYTSITKDKNEDVIIANDDDGFTLYNLAGESIYSGKGELGSFSNGLAIIPLPGNKYSYIDTTGKIINLSQYDYVGEYSDGLIAVKKNGKYGFIQKDGSIAIPFIYDDAKDFSLGITLVAKDGTRGLINTKNEFVVPLVESPGYSISTNFEKRIYSFGNEEYDEKGRLIE